MAGNNRTNNLHDAPVFKYKQLIWGDLIYGTKEQLQRIGIAAGMTFPGELNGPKRSLRVTDPRGFEARVKEAEYQGDGLFSVSISFPGRKRPEYLVSDFASGVKKTEYPWGDIFTGTAESLSAAGLVRRDQLPGQPGMRKAIVTILADGSFPKGAPTANCSEAREPGAIRIYRKSKAVYEVSIHVTREEEERRRDKHSRADQWEARMMSLPRPEPLCRINQERKEPHALDPLKLASLTLDMLNIQLNEPGLAPFSKESEANIQRLIDELRTAFAEATFVKIPKYTVDGNVVYLSKC